MLVMGIGVALHGCGVKPMYEAILENLATLAKLALTDASNLMLAGGLDLLPIFAIALTLVLLTARVVKSKHGGSFKAFGARSTLENHRTTIRFFDSKRSPMLKPCPNCAEELPLSAIICDACDYNFLAARPGRGQKLLPPPEAVTREVTEQRIASAAL
jgi:hypothetical protein